MRYNLTDEPIRFGELRLFPLDENETVLVRFQPVRGFDGGEGNGRVVEREITGGRCRVYRGRSRSPLAIAQRRPVASAQVM